MSNFWVADNHPLVGYLGSAEFDIGLQSKELGSIAKGQQLTHTHHLREGNGDEEAPQIGPHTYEYDGRAVDEFLWKGDPKATPIQRVGSFIISLWFLLPFAGFIAFVILDHYWLNKLIGLAMATVTGILGFRLLLNTFRHKKRRN